jgi:GT2 family glycosyltransferase
VRDGAGTIAACLEALGASNLRAFEAIVVDDGSRDASAAIARTFPCRVIEMACNRGPAGARNRGAEKARADILFFLDADITVTPTTLGEVVASFAQRPRIAALFSSYSVETIPSNFFTQYKNLVHHHTHQTAREDASTFCGGYGAIRRHVFLEMGGFSEDYRMLEDIELGYRLHRAGHEILLNKSIQVTHHKTYTLAGLVKSDVFGRAIPWTRIMLARRIARNDLNTRLHNVLSVAASWALVAAVAIVPASPSARAAAAAALALGLLGLNHAFLAFVLRARGPLFALATFPMLCLTYLYSGLGLVLGIAGHLKDGLGARRSAGPGIGTTNEDPLRYVRPAVSARLGGPDA